MRDNLVFRGSLCRNSSLSSFPYSNSMETTLEVSSTPMSSSQKVYKDERDGMTACGVVTLDNATLGWKEDLSEA